MRHRGRKHGGKRKHHHGKRVPLTYPIVNWLGEDKPKKPRAPRKKKAEPLGAIEEAASRPVRKIRIVKE